MSELLALVDRIDALCADFAAAMQASQLELYPAVALAVMIAFMLSSRRDADPL
jgi:hypothetical protein